MDDSEVGAACQEVGGKGVAEHVGVGFFEACLVGVVFDELPDSDAFYWSACAGEEYFSLVAAVGGALGGDEHRAALFEVLIEGVDCWFAHGDEAVFVAFAEDSYDADAFLEVG